MTDISIQTTTVTELPDHRYRVEMILADNADLETAKSRIHFVIEPEIDDPARSHSFAMWTLIALRDVQTAINAAYTEKRDLVDRNL